MRRGIWKQPVAKGGGMIGWYPTPEYPFSLISSFP